MTVSRPAHLQVAQLRSGGCGSWPWNTKPWNVV